MKTFSNLYWWILHRLTRRYNIVRLHSLEPTYWDIDTRLLHAIMNLVVDFVEIEQASLHYWVEEGEKIAQKSSEPSFEIAQKSSLTSSEPSTEASAEPSSKFIDYSPPKNSLKRSLGIFFSRLFPETRSRTKGLHALDAQIAHKETPPHQRKCCRVVKEVYLWWKDTRPVRQDVEDASGWSEFLEDVRKNPKLWDDKQQLDYLLELGIEIEKKYLKEDKEMMKKIIDISEHLWT
jgi:hypothetical protein